MAEALRTLIETARKGDRGGSWYQPYVSILLYREGSKSTEVGFRVCFTR
jgi:hypothetical protein